MPVDRDDEMIARDSQVSQPLREPPHARIVNTDVKCMLENRHGVAVRHPPRGDVPISSGKQAVAIHDHTVHTVQVRVGRIVSNSEEATSWSIDRRASGLCVGF
jgi:hypothetical protein